VEISVGAVLKMLPSSVEEGVGGGADCGFEFSVSGITTPAVRYRRYSAYFFFPTRMTMPADSRMLSWRVPLNRDIS